MLEATLVSLGFDELMGELLVRLRDVLEVDTAAVLMLDEATNELVARAAVGLEEEVEQSVRIPVGGGFAGRVAAEARPIVLDDVDHADVLNPILREKGIKSMLGVPLIESGSVIGVLHVGTLEPRFFNLDDQELLQLVASRAAIAIEKAKVHDELVRLDQLKLNFVAIASHELRTPATSVYGIASTLRHHRDSAHSRDPRGARRRVVGAGDPLPQPDRAAARPLTAGRQGDTGSSRQPVLLRELLAEIANASAPDADIRIEVPAELEVECRPGGARAHLRQPRPERRHLRRAARRRQRADRRTPTSGSASRTSGEGVPPEIVPRLFERFERGSVGQGSGLGLSIAQAYARAHGAISSTTPSLSGGARFDLILPRPQNTL